MTLATRSRKYVSQTDVFSCTKPDPYGLQTTRRVELLARHLRDDVSDAVTPHNIPYVGSDPFRPVDGTVVVNAENSRLESTHRAKFGNGNMATRAAVSSHLVDEFPISKRHHVWRVADGRIRR